MFTYRFDTGSPDQLPEPDQGLYHFGVGSLDMMLGTDAVTVTSLLSADVLTQGGDHVVNLNAFRSRDSSHAVSVLLNVSDSTGHWLSSDAWPTDLAALLNRASFKGFTIRFPEDEDEFDTMAFGTVVAFTQTPAPAPVPEPTTFLLLGTGVAGIAARRWRRRQPT
jgi:hypothetical protein